MQGYSLYAQATRGELWSNWKNLAGVMGLSDKDAYAAYTAASGVPILGSLLKASDSVRAMDDYMGNRGLNYGSVQYPTATVGAGLGSATGAALSLSKTLFSLY